MGVVFTIVLIAILGVVVVGGYLALGKLFPRRQEAIKTFFEIKDDTKGPVA